VFDGFRVRVDSASTAGDEGMERKKKHERCRPKRARVTIERRRRTSIANARESDGRDVARRAERGRTVGGFGFMDFGMCLQTDAINT